MELLLILFGVMTGAASVETTHYQACKADGFDAKVCQAKLDRCLKYSKEPCLK